MKTRRFSITQAEAELIESALDIIIHELEKHTDELTTRELNQLSQTRNLNRRLQAYQWEVE